MFRWFRGRDYVRNLESERDRLVADLRVCHYRRDQAEKELMAAQVELQKLRRRVLI